MRGAILGICLAIPQVITLSINPSCFLKSDTLLSSQRAVVFLTLARKQNIHNIDQLEINVVMTQGTRMGMITVS